MAYLCSRRHPQGAADVHILWGQPTVVGCHGLEWSAGLRQGAWGDRPGHGMQSFCCFKITLSADQWCRWTLLWSLLGVTSVIAETGTFEGLQESLCNRRSCSPGAP